MIKKIITIVMASLAVAVVALLLISRGEGAAALPIYPGAKGEGSTGGGAILIYPRAVTHAEYYTKDEPDVVLNWYKSEMPSRGWTLIYERELPPPLLELTAEAVEAGVSGFSSWSNYYCVAYVKGDIGVVIHTETYGEENTWEHTFIRLSYGIREAIENIASTQRETWAYPVVAIGTGTQDNKLVLWHGGGHTVAGAFRDNGWGNLEVRYYGSPLATTGALLNGNPLDGSDFKPGDILNVLLPTTENVMIKVIYTPTGKELSAFGWKVGI